MGFGTTPQLRVLRRGLAAGLYARSHLLLRMHLLRRLRRNRATQRLPELWRRVCAAAHPARERMAPRPFSREAAALNQARAPVLCHR
jgi:hypothetical protein